MRNIDRSCLGHGNEKIRYSLHFKLLEDVRITGSGSRLLRIHGSSARLFSLVTNWQLALRRGRCRRRPWFNTTWDHLSTRVMQSKKHSTCVAMMFIRILTRNVKSTTVLSASVAHSADSFLDFAVPLVSLTLNSLALCTILNLTQSNDKGVFNNIKTNTMTYLFWDPMD